ACRNLAAIGPQVGPPSPPESTTSTANAMLPLNPISQASVFSGCPVPYSAVPVLPNVPAGRPCPAAVPDATTCAIIWCRSLTTAGGSRWVAAVSSGAPTTRRGARTVPVSTAAATIAMFSGEASTRPCPIDVAARSAWSDGVGTDPAYAANPICGALPSPNSAAVDGKSGGVRCAVASPMKAVLHDSANASSRSLTCPSPSALWNTSPPAVAVAGQLAADEGESPWLISAVEVSTLNVEPGG